MTAEDIQVNRVYEAKRRRGCNLFNPVFNDRQVLWMDASRTLVQYDSPTVGNGRHYPKVSLEKFLKWAGRDVTNLMPPNREWRPYESKPKTT